MDNAPLELAKRLINIPSVNPSFRPQVDADIGGRTAEMVCGEGRLTDFLQQFCQDQRWDWARQRVHEGRENLIAVIPGSQAAVAGATPYDDVELWDVHQDTVGVDGMQIAPFDATVSDGRLWGRGACDVKGPMAALLAALARRQTATSDQVSDDAASDAASDAADHRPTILLACTVNEENGFTGVEALCRLWDLSARSTKTSSLDSASLNDSEEDTTPPIVAGTLSADDLRRYRPQRAVVLEPTTLDVVVAHKGVVRWQCHVAGRAAHSAQPECGENAIVAVAEVVRTIDRYQQEELAAREPHRFCGRPTVCVSMIRGGAGVNTVPADATIDIDRRLLPSESPEDAFRDLVEYVDRHAQVGSCRVSHDLPWMQSTGLDDGNNGTWAEQVAEAVRAAGGSGRRVGVPYGTNASIISQLGIPTVVLGPGSIAQAHTSDEWIEIDQLNQAAEVYYRLVQGPVTA